VRITVVIPTLGEQATIESAIASARAALGPCQVIVADGGSADGTRELAAAAGATVIDAPGTRADAMNTGARAATGEAILFLHADTTLPAGAGSAVRGVLVNADAGAFSVRFDDRPRLARFAAGLGKPFHRGVYGDQGIFVTRAAFDRVGGYRPLPIMEDIDFVQRIRRTGRFVVLPDTVTTSGRRQRAHGEVRTFVIVHTIKLLYRVGVPPAHLAALDRAGRSSRYPRIPGCARTPSGLFREDRKGKGGSARHAGWPDGGGVMPFRASRPYAPPGVLIEVLSFDGCPNRDPAVELVERIVRETGIAARIDVIDVTDEETASMRRFLGSPTIFVAGHDIEPGAEARTDYSISCRVYRTADGLKGLPDAQWLRDALA